MSTPTSATLLGNKVTSYESLKQSGNGRTGAEMGKQDFLTLFTAQLKNQDPLDPVKNEAFVAQLAQFSQLEATTNMSTSLQGLVSTMANDKLFGAASLIGRRVPVTDSPVKIEQGQSTQAYLELDQGASGVTLTVTDSKGTAVKQLMAGPQNPGTANLIWDGTDDQGNFVPSGTYRLTANAVIEGQNQRVPVNALDTVISVITNPVDNTLSLNLGGGSTMPLSQIKRIVN